MLLENKLGLQCFVLFLLFHLKFSSGNAAYSQFKREQQLPQQKKEQQTQPMPQNSQIQTPVLSNAQNTQEKDKMQSMMKHINSPVDDFNDHFQMMNELKQETRATSSTPMPWNSNPYMNQGNFAQTPFSFTQPYAMPFSSLGLHSMMETPKFFPFIGFPQPMFIPFPLFYQPTLEMLYSMFSGGMNNFDDTMSRTAGGRRPSPTHARDSPIYYMRLPPTPYMFLPNFGYTPASTNFGGSFSSFLPYQSLTAFSPTFNLPVNFVANGKPSGIYQMTSPPANDIQNPFTNFNNLNARPSMQSNFNGNYASPSYGMTSTTPPVTDSRMTLLKQPFIFNGRPEEIVILQNSFNPMFTGL